MLSQKGRYDEPKGLESELNAMVKCREEIIATEDSIPVEPFLLFRGEIIAFSVDVLEDYGCHVNIVGTEFLRIKKNGKFFKI